MDFIIGYTLRVLYIGFLFLTTGVVGGCIEPGESVWSHYLCASGTVLMTAAVLTLGVLILFGAVIV